MITNVKSLVEENVESCYISIVQRREASTNGARVEPTSGSWRFAPSTLVGASLLRGDFVALLGGTQALRLSYPTRRVTLNSRPDSAQDL